MNDAVRLELEIIVRFAEMKYFPLDSEGAARYNAIQQQGCCGMSHGTLLLLQSNTSTR